MKVVGLVGSYPSASGLFALVYLLEMVLIPPRIEFSNVRYISGSYMRSSSTCVCLRAMDQAKKGRVG